ncbi:MAG: hypothetical protein HYY03_01475 [Chloroflexi bacterium]|nr:hypothetical protein [Chloroflexota bacterium]
MREPRSKHESQRGEFTDNGEKLPPELNKRIQRLLVDLAADDLSMAFLDLAQLHRGLADLSRDRLPDSQAVHAGTPAKRNGDSGREDDWEPFFA